MRGGQQRGAAEPPKELGFVFKALLRDKCIKNLGLGLRAVRRCQPGTLLAPQTPGTARRSRAPQKQWGRASWGAK